METNKRVDFHPYHRLNKFITALAFVVAGFVILGHNIGAVNDYFYRIIISWQMLLIVMGISAFLKRNLLVGGIFAGVGIYFLLPRITGMEVAWLTVYWPVFLIFFGVILLFHRHKNPWQRWRHDNTHNYEGGKRTERIIDGFVTVDISFGNSRHIVLDPIFRGAKLDNSFGSITLDLRRTSLESSETYIDVDCSFGGVEIFVPPNWCLLSEIDNTCGSNEDKRYISHEVDTTHKLIIRGDVSFGTLEIKN
ncbi:MAG: cell wall-active antibiotics response protein [Tannerellaceae bacterium]|nr:cell wall-active antibiotics response protein [Tannerellaceae bacterium]